MYVKIFNEEKYHPYKYPEPALLKNKKMLI
jgi:hypothetical protein